MTSRTKHVPNERAMAEQLLQHTPNSLKKRAKEVAETGDQSLRAPHADIARWVRKCLQSHGCLTNHDLNAAAAELGLSPSHLSAARVAVGAATFRNPEAAGPSDPSYTDFTARIPANAVRMGRHAGSRNKKNRPVEPVIRSQVEAPPMPTDPDDERGRRLDQGDLTEAQRLEAEERMRNSSRMADEEAREIRERLAAGGALSGQAREPLGVQLPDERDHANGNGNGNGAAAASMFPGIPQGMVVALEMMLEQALAATFSLTEQDILTLKGQQEMHRRHAEESTAAAGAIGLLLKRVAAKKAEAAAV